MLPHVLTQPPPSPHQILKNPPLPPSNFEEPPHVLKSWWKTLNISIFRCKSVEMAIDFAGMLSQDQKMGFAKEILPNF